MIPDRYAAGMKGEFYEIAGCDKLPVDAARGVITFVAVPAGGGGTRGAMALWWVNT